MAGADFNKYVYTADSTVKHPIRMSADAAAAQTTAAATTGATSSISARVGGSRRALGLHARGLRLQRTTGTGVNAKSFFTFLPILLPADYNASTANPGSAFTVGGVAYTVSSKTPERSN